MLITPKRITFFIFQDSHILTLMGCKYNVTIFSQGKHTKNAQNIKILTNTQTIQKQRKKNNKKS